MKLIVGLGNPGKQYEKTRHNIGFMVLGRLRETMAEYQIGSWDLSKKFNAQIAGCTIGGEKIILAKPMTFMNASGESVQMIAHFYKMTAKDIILVQDDKDLKLGVVKTENNRGAAGHNGVASVITHIGTKNFTRVRVGIASDNARKMKQTAKFVLGKFGIFEKNAVEQSIRKSVQEIMLHIESKDAS
jgi:PTH1 family peptidyl-tRNA hydrolase